MIPNALRALRRLQVVVALAGATFTAQAALYEAGTGPDTSYLILESPNIGLREYAVHYTYDPAVPMGSYDLLKIVEAAEPRFSILNGGSEENAYIASITWDGVTEAGNNSPPYTPYWSQWVAGGQAGAEFDFPWGPAPVPVPGDSWSYGSGISAPYRIIEPGSNDALVYGDGSAPSLAPTPEPGVLLLAGLALPALLLHRPRRS